MDLFKKRRWIFKYPIYSTLIYTITTHPDITLTKLIKLTGVSHSYASKLLQELIKKGLVKNSQDNYDTRQRRLTMTKYGLKIGNYIKKIIEEIKDV